MKPSKKYLRNKIVYNFMNDIRNVINRFIILKFNFLTDDSTKLHIK